MSVSAIYKNDLHYNTIWYYYVNTMKRYHDNVIRQSEIIQLIILHCLYSLKESKDIFLQGGTAIRWCHNGNRFSEDLDFVIHGDAKTTDGVMNKLFQQIRREAIAHLGLGTFEIIFEKSSRISSHVYYCDFIPGRERGKISIKVEFEELNKDLSLDTEKMILSMLPPVRRLIAAGDFKIPSPSSIILVETMEEILSDKIRALLERRYLKGRDFYDTWFLNSLGITCTEENITRKLIMYKMAFVRHRQIDFF